MNEAAWELDPKPSVDSRKQWYSHSIPSASGFTAQTFSVCFSTDSDISEYVDPVVEYGADMIEFIN